MLSSLLRPRRSRRPRPSFNSSSPYAQRSSPVQKRRETEDVRHAQADWTETENDEEDSDDEEVIDEGEEVGAEDAGVEDEGDEDGHSATPLLPIFSAAHLDSLPVYNLTHAIRLIVLPRVETHLTWDQLRSPQVSQFLVKPMQQQIRTSHFSRATLYALMANCLQFGKEGQMNPGNAGTSKTRAMVCELLALKLLKEYNTRELIDALSYDFYPLQGLVPENDPISRQNSELKNRSKGAAARISTLEVAIRAQAKKFLAHPSVVQQLEAIWAGTIVFHSTADHLHRQPPTLRGRPETADTERTPLLSGSPDKDPPSRSNQRTYSEPVQISARRTVTLYDPRDASLFKLSRLRVPRYRQFFSTCSLAILLVLFLAVLSQRSSDITRLEVVFWLWSAGFMLDEVVGFNEQGFSLYLMSFWNTFDLGILLIFFVYYCMRIYGIFLIDGGRHEWNSMAYDVLAANAVLLFPRLFSVLDHYRYFSQLLIAFRLMAVDLVAVFVLILISCSGFFVAFTLSFGEDYNAGAVAYALFQMLMGFTPAAWSIWDDYNLLGQAILTLFLFMCHFLIVTILITVLTNSFMAIVSNANEEHQFVFAVNTISMVKSDALFSYLAPTNLLAWFLAPFRYAIPFRQFVKVNRYIIKLTHFPLLFSIYAYERVFLARKVYAPTDLVENPGRSRKRLISFMDPESRGALFSPGPRMRTESVAGVQKDRALDEVFRLAPRGDFRANTKSQQTKNVVNNWMDQQEGIASPPPEQDRSIVDRLERSRQASKMGAMKRMKGSRGVSGTRSVASDPADLMSVGHGAYRGFDYDQSEVQLPTLNIEPQTEDDGDDELVTNDEEENMTLGKVSRDDRSNIEESRERQLDYFQTPKASRWNTSRRASLVVTPREIASPPTPPTAKRRTQHDRNASTNTILFNPQRVTQDAPPERTSTSGSTTSPTKTRPLPQRWATGTNTPKRNPLSTSRPRPILTSRNTLQDVPRQQMRHRRSSLDIQLDLGSDFGLQDQLNVMMPSSFQTQMAMATAMEKRRGEGQEIMSRIMLARMKTLEEGFAEVVREFRESRSLVTSKAGSKAASIDLGLTDEGKARKERREGKRVVRSRPSTATGKGKAIMIGGDKDEKENKKEETPEEELLREYENRPASF